jgi:hypothetical protein
MTGSYVDMKIADTMRRIWTSNGQLGAIPDSRTHKAIFALRTNAFYQWVLVTFKQHVLPFVSAAFLLWLGATGLSHFLFNVADSTGVFCHETAMVDLEYLNGRGDRSQKDHVFSTQAICSPTGVHVENGARYSVRIELTSPSKDDKIEADPNGFRTARLSSWPAKLVMYSGVPLRRVLFRPWFRLIARVGASGTDEYFLDPEADPHQRNVYEATFKAERDGELFLYVNDAVIALPYLHDIFYWNNNGTAKISVQRR